MIKVNKNLKRSSWRRKGEVSLSSSESLGENSPERRQRGMPFWMEDYVSGEEFFEEDVEHNNLVQFTSTSVSTTLQEIAHSSKWKVVMDLEIEAIKRNETWELIDLPKGMKKIRVKWIYKTKLNVNGEVDKFMASPMELHLQVTKRVVRYLKGTIDLGVFY
ncbi:hypothetical protein ZIOFF_003130 [Zingiber officinale]|uniref:Reverse transcriptase Ty1/copia-type domain-containing protein n=1 Tax=Zingiber officinale TaxID=94328 RepID=A0A8J5HXX2_ZINOF|nr:hypothetical protein ZIOFF_003130 [Zingiber officinale]